MRQRPVSEGQYEYVDVVFPTADMDTAVRHEMRPSTPHDVRYSVGRVDRASHIYDDQSAGRRPWTSGVIYLRASVAGTRARIKLYLERENRE